MRKFKSSLFGAPFGTWGWRHKGRILLGLLAPPGARAGLTPETDEESFYAGKGEAQIEREEERAALSSLGGRAQRKAWDKLDADIPMALEEASPPPKTSADAVRYLHKAKHGGRFPRESALRKAFKRIGLFPQK